MNILSRMWSTRAVWMCALLLSACGPAPPSVDSYQVSVEPQGSSAVDSGSVGVSQAANGLYQISGAPGSVPVGSTVYIINLRTPETVIYATPNADGSFVALISAQVGDKLEITVVQNSLGSPPTYVYVGGLNIKTPYTSDGNWYVGQVHFHTTNSDGANSPALMEAAYHDAGYDFVVSTDHRGTLPFFADAIHGLTPDPDNSAGGKDLLWIRGSEIGFGSVHMGAWGHTVRTPVVYDPDRPVDMQQRIDHVRSYGGLIAINHPHNEDPPYAWDWYGEIKKTRRYSFVEAFNGKHALGVDGSFEISHLPTAVDLADEYYQVWWIGADDCHDKDDPTQFNRYAVVVQTASASINQADILGSADAGNMYIRETARGPAMTSLSVEGNTITLVMADVASRYDVTWKKRGDEVLQTNLDVDTTAAYTIVGDEGYVRAEITRKSDGLHAYTQPLFIANNVDLSAAVSVSSGSNPGHLIDNNHSTYWEAQAGAASFVVDVGSVRLVNAVKMDWYSGDPRRFNYKIETSETGAFAGEQKEVVRETFGNRSATTLDFFDEVTRYVRVTVTSQSVGSGSTVRIGEVQVFDASPGRTQLYIDNVSGSDSNSGLFGSPWLTFGNAREKVRPRDTLNFINTGIPYLGSFSLLAQHSGKHRYATIRFLGDKTRLTELDASGQFSGLSIAGSSYVEWKYFDIHSASTADILTNENTANVSIMYNRLHGSAGKGLLGAGDFVFAYNLVYGNGQEGAMIYRDGTDAKIYNNVFYGNATSGLLIDNYYLTKPAVTQVMNNIFSGNAGSALSRGMNGAITDARNCVDGAYVGSWQRTASVEANPLFLSPPAADFRLQAASPCIDAGIDLGLSPDFAGNPPHDAPLVPNSGDPGASGKNYVDIGAYEFTD